MTTNFFNVINATKNPVQVMITTFSSPTGDDAWFTIQPGGTESWNRGGFELVAFMSPTTVERCGLYMNCANNSPAYTFNGFFTNVDNNLSAAAKGFNIRNVTTTPIQAFVTNNSGGDVSWFDVPADYSDPAKCHWTRNGYEAVVFLDPSTQKRHG